MRQAQGIEHVNSTTPALRLEVLHLEHIDILQMHLSLR